MTVASKDGLKAGAYLFVASTMVLNPSANQSPQSFECALRDSTSGSQLENSLIQFSVPASDSYQATPTLLGTATYSSTTTVSLACWTTGGTPANPPTARYSQILAVKVGSVH